MNNGTPQKPTGMSWDPATTGAPTVPTTAPSAPLRLPKRFAPPPVLDRVTPPKVLFVQESKGVGRLW